MIEKKVVTFSQNDIDQLLTVKTSKVKKFKKIYKRSFVIIINNKRIKNPFWFLRREKNGY